MFKIRPLHEAVINQTKPVNRLKNLGKQIARYLQSFIRRRFYILEFFYCFSKSRIDLLLTCIWAVRKPEVTDRVVQGELVKGALQALSTTDEVLYMRKIQMKCREWAEARFIRAMEFPSSGQTKFGSLINYLHSRWQAVRGLYITKFSLESSLQTYNYTKLE